MAMDSVLYTLRLWQREYSVLIARVTEKQAVGAPRIAHSYFRLMKWPLGKLAPDYSSGARRRPCCAAQVLGFEAMVHPVVPSRDLWLGGGWRAGRVHLDQPPRSVRVAHAEIAGRVKRGRSLES